MPKTDYCIEKTQMYNSKTGKAFQKTVTLLSKGQCTGEQKHAGSGQETLGSKARNSQPSFCLYPQSTSHTVLTHVGRIRQSPSYIDWQPADSLCVWQKIVQTKNQLQAKEPDVYWDKGKQPCVLSMDRIYFTIWDGTFGKKKRTTRTWRGEHQLIHWERETQVQHIMAGSELKHEGGQVKSEYRHVDLKKTSGAVWSVLRPCFEGWSLLTNLLSTQSSPLSSLL